MAFKNFTGNDDDANNPGGPGGPGGGGPAGPGGAPPFFMGNAAQAGADITEILVDYNKRFKDAAPAMFRDQLIALTMSVLISKDKPNPLLVGSAGVGKTRIVEEIARLIANSSPAVPTQLRKYTVFELPLSSIVAGGGIVGEIEERVTKIVDFATDPKNKAILFIDEIHLLQSRDTTYTKIAQMLKPALARGDMHLVGATTGQEGRKLDDDPAFARRFSRIVVDELTRDQTVQVLTHARDTYLTHYGHQVMVPDALLPQIAVIADENSRASAKRPDNALTLLDKAMADSVVRHSGAVARAQDAGNTQLATLLQQAVPLNLSPDMVRDVAVKLMTGMPTKQVYDETAILQGLTRLKGQDTVLTDLVDALRRDALAAFPRTRPLGWMLAGPSGVGKTEATKIISRALTGQDPIMLNMAEYDEKHTTSKLLGSPPGYVGSESDRELPFDTLESNPYRVILLDEFEKAHPSVHKLFLSALEEGWLQMASGGKKIDFSKAIIVATTNAGQESMNRTPLGFSASNGPRVLSRQELVKLLQGFFAPELLGRFAKLVAFAPLDRKVYREIFLAAYDRERERIVTDSPRRAQVLPAALDTDVVDQVVEESYLVDQGARPAEQACRKLIEDLLLAPASSVSTTATAAAVTDEDSIDLDEQ